ncbi:MAG: hypothetical protein M0P31_07490 [Solirubrobacteraceae bacterium]|nr:hypothetical protein [Solirubrobacteraceae bacterium]
MAVRDADPPLPTSTSVAVGSGVAPSKLQLRFAVFRETDAPTTAVPDAPDPGTMLRQFANGAIAGLEVDRAGARVLSVPDAVVVVAPARTATGAEQVCMVVSNRYKGGGTSADCAPTAKVLADGLFSVSDIDAAVARAAELDPDTRVVDGLVPDGATAVRIETADGDLIDAPVSDNAISVSVTGEPVRATFRDRSGTNRKADL